MLFLRDEPRNQPPQLLPPLIEHRKRYTRSTVRRTGRITLQSYNRIVITTTASCYYHFS